MSERNDVSDQLAKALRSMDEQMDVIGEELAWLHAREGLLPVGDTRWHERIDTALRRLAFVLDEFNVLSSQCPRAEGSAPTSH
jgi:hypothetical protein